MASYRVKWMISMLAFVGCVLVSPVASDDQALEALQTQLKRDDITVEEIDSLLQNYKYSEDVLDFFTIRELAESCKMSLSKCSHDGYLETYFKIGVYQDSLPRVSEYVKDCMRVKVKHYCREHIDEVAKNLIGEEKDKDKELIRPILESLKEAGVLDEAPDLDFSYWVVREEDSIYFEQENGNKNGNAKLYAEIEKAYSEAMRAKLGDSPTAEQEKHFLDEVSNAFGLHTLNYFFMRELSDRNKEGPEPGNVLVTNLYKSSRIAAHFSVGVWRKIYREVKEKIDSQAKSGILKEQNERKVDTKSEQLN